MKMKKLTALICVLMMLICTAAPALAATKFSASTPKDAQLKALSLVERCGFSSEYQGTRDMVRWETPIRIYVGGKPTKADLNTLDNFLIQLSSRVPGLPNITRVSSESSANVKIYFVPLKQLGNYVPGYVSGNWGMFHYNYTSWKITNAEIGIATDKTNQKSRNHLIMEELVGALGLANDHNSYSDSILYQPWTTTQELSEVDWMMLNMLYHKDVYPGMTWNSFYQTTYSRINRR